MCDVYMESPVSLISAETVRLTKNTIHSRAMGAGLHGYPLAK